MHIVLIVGHAVCGLTAFVCGCGVLAPPRTKRIGLFRLYLGALVAMISLLALVVVLDWQTLALTLRVVFSGLGVLALYTGWRGWHASQMLPTGKEGTYTDDVGFTLITLFTGFVIIAALDLGNPIWLVVLIGVLGVGSGILGIKAVKQNTRR